MCVETGLKEDEAKGEKGGGGRGGRREIKSEREM